MTEKRKKRLTILGMVLFVAAIGLLSWFVGRPLIRFASEPEKFRVWVESYGWGGRLLFTGMMALQTIVAFIPGEPLEIAAGYAFGTFMGTALCIAGELIGSVSVFLFVRRFGMKSIEVFFSREKIDSLKFLKNEKKLETLVFFIFLIPGTPKDILCYCVGLTRMRLTTWLLISSVARFPSVITSTIGGNALGLGDRMFAVVVFAITFALSVAGLLVYNQMVKRRAAREKRPKAAKARAIAPLARAHKRYCRKRAKPADGARECP